MTIKATDPRTGNVTVIVNSESYLSWGTLGLGSYAWPEDGQSNEITVTVRVISLADSTYSNAPSVEITVYCTDTTVFYTVTYVDGLGNELASYTVAEETATEKPDDPTREYYSFAGWSPAVADAVTANVTYTAVWTALLDNNGNGIADQEETYTVRYVDGMNGEVFADAVHEGLAWGADTPAAPEFTSPENKNFKGWDVSVAETVSAPVSGNTVTYTAQWTDAWVVTFEGHNYKAAVEVEGTDGTVSEPVDSWDDDHDFLGWYNGDDRYDFSAAVTGNLTLVARWRTDVNRNDVEDADEPHYTVKYVVDGVETVFADILVGLATPAVDDPAKSGYKFGGWKPAVADTVTADAIYTALWLADVNGNNVDDSLETVTVTVVTASSADSVSVSGAVRLSGTDSWVFDSTKSDSLVITATPVSVLTVSSTFVSGVTVDGVAAEGEYSNYVFTASIAPANGMSVVVTFLPAEMKTVDGAVMNYYAGVTIPNVSELYTTFVESPAYAEDAEITVKYLAREAYTDYIDFADLTSNNILLALIKTVNFTNDNSTQFGIEMPELWLDFDEEIKDSVSVKEAAATYLNEEVFDELLALAAKLDYSGVKDKLTEIFEHVVEAATYYNARPFGYNDTESETVTEEVRITYKDSKVYLSDTITVTLQDLRASSVILGNDISVIYKDYTDEDLLAAIRPYAADAVTNEAVEDAEIVCVQLTEYSMEGVSVSTHTVTVKFKGNENYKPSEATFTVTVTQAPITTFDIPNQVVEYGTAYDMEPELVLGNKYGEADEVLDSRIEFLLGLDVADLDIDSDGVKGLEGRLQLFLPAGLQDTLDGLMSWDTDGLEMSLSDLRNYLELLNDSSLTILSQAISALEQITETGDITIVIGGDLPTDIGVYLYGAVTTNANYETAFDVAYLVIKPAASRVYLDWNYSDTNGLFTPELLQFVDLGASAYNDEAFAEINAEASALINNLFFGIDANGELVTEFFNAGVDPEEIEKTLGNGAYTQLAFIVDFGNELYYAVPAARLFAVIPNTVELSFVGDTGDNHRILRTFYKDLQQTVEVEILYEGTAFTPDSQYLTVEYIGMQTNAQEYERSTEAPVHAGAYLVVATYIQKDERGEIVAIGANLAVLAIEPAESSVEVKDLQINSGEEANIVRDMVTVTTDSGVSNPDVTVITAAIKEGGDFLSEGWSAIDGLVNVDLPAWLDAILSEQYPGMYAEDGITAADFLAKAELELPEVFGRIEALIAEYGAELDLSGYAEQLNSLLGRIGELVKELPAETVLKFEDATVYEIGVYAVAAIVTDSDHYPSADTGVLIIAPQIVDVVFVDETGAENDDRKFTFDNSAKAMDVRVTLNGEAVDTANGSFSIRYVGVQTNGKSYDSETAPVHAGVYVVTVSYTEYAANGELKYVGAAVGIMAIEPAESSIEVTGTAEPGIVYDGEGHGVASGDVTVNVTGKSYADHTLISGGAYVSGDISEVGADAFHGNVNVDLPAWLDTALAEGGYEFADGISKTYLIELINACRDYLKAAIPVETLEKIDALTEGELGDYLEKLNAYAAQLDGYVDTLLALIDKLPEDVTLTFNDGVSYTEPGYYLYFGIVTDSDHYPSADAGLLVIEKMDMVFDLLDTEVTYNGEERFVNVNNPQNADHISVIIDRDGNTLNIVLDDDAQYLLDLLMSALDAEFDGDVQLSTLLDNYNGAEIAAAVAKLIERLDTPELPEELGKALNALKAELEKVNTVTGATVTVNGALPVDAGEYEVYALSYAEHYNTEASAAKLVIKPAAARIFVDSHTVKAGAAMPELTYGVEGLFGDDQLDITVVCSAENTYTAGEYSITATVAANKNYTVTVKDGTLTVEAAELEVENLTAKEDDELFEVVPHEGVITVSHETACTVLVKREDGSYERLSATVDENGNYDFDVSSLLPGESLVIAVAGDINGDGKVDAADAAAARAVEVGLISATELQGLIMDINGDGTVDAADAAVARAAEVGLLTIPW